MRYVFDRSVVLLKAYGFESVFKDVEDPFLPYFRRLASELI